MTEKYDELWEKFLKEAKILKLKTIRGWHRLDKEFGISRFAKKMTLALALKLIALSAPNAQISLHAQAPQKKGAPIGLLAMASQTKNNPDYADFVEKHREIIMERQKEFAFTLWDVIIKNNKDIQEVEPKGIAAKRKKLHQMFDQYKSRGLSVDPSYFCATAGLGSLIETIEEYDFKEYELLMQCLTSPNSCSGIIRDIKANFGDQKETNDIPKTLSEIYKKNPYAVCVVFPHSKTSRSGYHYTTTFSNVVAVDTLLTPEDSIKGKTVRFNRTAVADIDEYYTKGAKRGYVFDITEMIGNYQIFEMFQSYLNREQLKKFILKEPVHLDIKLPKVSFQPVAQVSHSEINEELEDAKNTTKQRQRKPLTMNAKTIKAVKAKRNTNNIT